MSESRPNALGLILFAVALVFSPPGWSLENPAPSDTAEPVALKALNFSMAGGAEPAAGKPGGAREPLRAWCLVSEPASTGAGGGIVTFSRLNANPSRDAQDLLKNPPSIEIWTVNIAADGSLSGLKGSRNSGVRSSSFELLDGKLQHARDGKISGEKWAWPEKTTVWPAALAEWFSRAPQKKGGRFTRNIADPWSKIQATLNGELAGFDNGVATFAITLGIAGKTVESFQVLARYEKNELTAVSLQNAGGLLTAVDGTVIQSLENRAAASLKSLDFKARDGTSLIDKIRACLAVKDVQAKPMFHSGMTEKEYLGFLKDVRTMEDALLTEDTDNLIAGCRLLTSDAEAVENQRLMVLAARTGSPAALPVVDACLNALNGGRRLLAVRDFRERLDPRSLDAMVLILSKSAWMCRDTIRKTFLYMSVDKPDVKQKIGMALLDFLDRPAIWTGERTGDAQLDGVIALLAQYPAPFATLTLNKYVNQTTVNERSEMIRVAGVIKDEVGVGMVRAVLSDLRGNMNAIMAGCKAAGEMKDLLCVKPLIPLLGAVNPRLVEQANLALKSISGEDYGPSMQPWSNWWNALLERSANPKKLVEDALGGTDKTRVEAMRILALLQLSNALPTLTQCAADPSVTLRAEALRGLGRFCGAEGLSVLIKALKDEAEPVRTVAHDALVQRTRESLPPGPAGEGAWSAWLNKALLQRSGLDQLLKLTGVAPAIAPSTLLANRTGGTASAGGAAPSGISYVPPPAETNAGNAEAPGENDDEQPRWMGTILISIFAVIAAAGAGYLYLQTRRDSEMRRQSRFGRKETIVKKRS